MMMMMALRACDFPPLEVRRDLRKGGLHPKSRLIEGLFPQPGKNARMSTVLFILHASAGVVIKRRSPGRMSLTFTHCVV